MMEQHQVEQALRRSHCSNSGKEHACVGTCTITPQGLELSCTLCGTDTPPNRDVNEWLEDRASSILHAAGGVLYEKLSSDAQCAILREIAKDHCPNCKTIKFHTKRYEDYIKCRCGWAWSSRRGWNGPTQAAELAQ